MFTSSELLGRRLANALVALAVPLLTAGYVFAQQPQRDLAIGPAVSNEQRVALVIGNGAYPSANLRNPVNDARAMAEKLTALGFNVSLKTDITRRQMDRAIVQFGESLTQGGVALFYFAGHGMQVRGKNFLMPVDAEINSEASVRSEAVDVEQVLDQLGPVRLSMVILDACRNNPFERRFRGMGDGGLAQIDAPKGTLIAYATAPGKTAADGAGANGLYTQQLLRALDRPGLKVEDVFKQVRINVSKQTNDAQIPWEASSLVGEFVFRADSNAATREEEKSALLKTVEQERAKRAEDERLLNLEMEKMRAELANLKERPTVAAAGARQVRTLTEMDMRSVFFGNTLTGGNPNGSSWNVYISPNGAAHIRGKGPNGAPMEDTGNVTIENDSWCNTWRRIGRGEKNCAFIERQGDKFVNRNVDGAINSLYIVRPGNPENL